MAEWLINYGSWFLALVGLTGLWLTGMKKTQGWLFSLAAQGLWAFYLIGTHQYGLLLGTAGYTVVYARGWWRWRRDDKDSLDLIKEGADR